MSAALDNLVKARQLNVEPRNPQEVLRLLNMARVHLADAQIAAVSLEGRFLSAYASGHAAGLAALRHHGYRSENRYIVFQCLSHTVDWAPEKWRMLDVAHRLRNLAEYEGTLEVEASQLDVLMQTVASLIDVVEQLTTRSPP